MRHIQRGHQRGIFVPTIASGTKAPTVAEMVAGIEFTDELVPGGIDGFLVEVDRADAADSGSDFDKTVRGTKKADGSALTLHLDDTDHTLKALFVEGLGEFVVWVDKNTGVIEAGTKVDVWPSEVSDNNTLRNADKDTNRFKVSFAHPDSPVFEIAVLA